jgi:hypothetical protein
MIRIVEADNMNKKNKLRRLPAGRQTGFVLLRRGLAVLASDDSTRIK